jgi:hypothetical protein
MERFCIARETAKNWANRRYFATLRPNARMILAVRASVDAFEQKRLVQALDSSSPPVANTPRSKHPHAPKRLSASLEAPLLRPSPARIARAAAEAGRKVAR